MQHANVSGANCHHITLANHPMSVNLDPYAVSNKANKCEMYWRQHTETSLCIVLFILEQAYTIKVVDRTDVGPQSQTSRQLHYERDHKVNQTKFSDRHHTRRYLHVTV